MPDDVFGLQAQREQTPRVQAATPPQPNAPEPNDDVFGLKGKTANANVFGLPTSRKQPDLGARIQTGVDHARDQAAYGGVRAMHAVLNAADNAPGQLGNAALARQRAISTGESAALSPKPVGNEVFGQMGRAFMDPSQQQKIDDTWQSTVQGLLEKIPGVSELLKNAPAVLNEGVVTHAGAPTLSLARQPGHGMGSDAANMLREGIAQVGSDAPDALLGRALTAGAKRFPSYANLGVDQARALRTPGGPFKTPQGPSQPLAHPAFHTDPLYAAVQAAAALARTRRGQQLGGKIRDVVAKTPLNPIVDKDLHDVAKPSTVAKIHGAHNADLTREAHLKQKQIEFVRAHAAELDANHVSPEARHLHQEDAWLNGTEKVRNEILDDPIRLANGQTVTEANPYLLDMPVLNLQTAYRKGYDPHTPLNDHLGDFDPELTRRVEQEDWGFNQLQSDRNPTTPRSKRYLARLELGRLARAEVSPRAAMGKALGIEGRGLSTKLAEAQLRNAEAAPRIVPNAWRYQSTPHKVEESPRGGAFFHRDQSQAEGYQREAEEGGLGGQHVIEAELQAKNPLLVSSQGSGIDNALNLLRPNKLGSRLLGDREFAAGPNDPEHGSEVDIATLKFPMEPFRFQFPDGMAGNLQYQLARQQYEQNLKTYRSSQQPLTPFPNFDEIPNIPGIDPPKKTTDFPITDTGHVFGKPFQEAPHFAEAGLPRGIGDTFHSKIDDDRNVRRYLKAAGMSDEQITKLTTFGVNNNDYSYTMKDKLASILAKKAGYDVIHKESGESFVLDPSIIKTGMTKERVQAVKDALQAQHERIKSDQDRLDELWTPKGLSTLKPAYVQWGMTRDEVKQLVSDKDSTFAYQPFSKEQHGDIVHALHRDMTRVIVPAVIAARLTTPKTYETGKNWLRGLSDIGRAALFWIPFTHMKNITTLQYEGPGGTRAAGRGAEIFPELMRNDPKHQATIEHLEQAGAAPHYYDAPTEKLEAGASRIDRVKNAVQRSTERAYRFSNKMLWQWDLAQRIALHEHFLEHGDGYNDLSPFEQGAAINTVLFDYYHKSPLAESLREWGAPFPHWTIGNATTQAKNFFKEPRKMATISRAENLINQNLFPPGTGYSFAANDPASESEKMGGDLTHYGQRTLINKGGPLLGTGANAVSHGQDIQDLALPATWSDMLGGVLTGLPGGSLGPQALKGAGDLAGGNNWATGLGDVLGADRFKSNAPALARLVLGLAGMSLPNDPSIYPQLQRDLKDADPFEQSVFYKYRHH